MSDKFDEICFKCLEFRTYKSDHCTVTDTCIKENHGYSKLFNRNIHLYNFRQYVFCTANYLNFLSLCIIAILRWQRVMELKSSNWFLRVVEMHIMGVINMLTKADLKLLPLLIAEILWVYFSSEHARQLYCISKKMTMLEMQMPYQFVQSRLGTIFEIRRLRVHGGNKLIKSYYSFVHVGLCSMCYNIITFMLCCRRGVHKTTSKQRDRLSS